MTPNEFNQAMRVTYDMWKNKFKKEPFDTEIHHISMDETLVAFIEERFPECSEGIEIYKKLPKWYS